MELTILGIKWEATHLGKYAWEVKSDKVHYTLSCKDEDDLRYRLRLVTRANYEEDELSWDWVT